jgi:carbon monoxide dehydrogenase subunit G
VRASPYVIDYRGTFHLPVAREVIWETIQEPDRFESWWGWLRDLTVEGRMLEPGAVLRGVVAPPLPYRMRLRVDLQECVRPSRIDAVVHGDLEGRAQLRFETEGDGTRAEAAWTIEMMQRPMRIAARFGHPLLRWGHDRVVDATVAGYHRQLRNRGLLTTPG